MLGDIESQIWKSLKFAVLQFADFHFPQIPRIARTPCITSPVFYHHSGCFLKQGICKYGYISTKAAFLLFKSEKGPFRNKKRMKLLRKELHEALKSTVPAYTKKSILESNQNTKDQVNYLPLQPVKIHLNKKLDSKQKNIQALNIDA